MNTANVVSIFNLLGFTLGVTLYGLLLITVVRYRGEKHTKSFNYLLFATGILGVLWNLGEVFEVVRRDFTSGESLPLLSAAAYSALGFLPSAAIDSANRNAENAGARILVYAAYALSFFAAGLHFHTAFFFDFAPSDFALRTLTLGSLVILAGLFVSNFKQTIEKKAVLAGAFLIFTLSMLHLNSHSENSSQPIEIFAHQSSLPLAFAILYQDYRFAFADLFLKRALSLILLTLTAFLLYVFIASPLLRFHETHDRNDVQAVALIIVLWAVTALIYPFLRKFAHNFVDKIILRRADYEKLRIEIARSVERLDSPEKVLDDVCRKLSIALTAQNSEVIKADVTDTSAGKFVFVNASPQSAEIFIPTHEKPFYIINLQNFAGGRRLLSEEIEMLESIAPITARRIDALRVTHERCETEIREREFSKLATEAQLSALRAQINPHFLFNTLTTIGYLIQAAPEKAFSTLMRLTQLLRGVLRSTGEFCTLGEEIKLIEAYLDIERARFEERLDVKFNIAPDLKNLKIPALILQPLVENAVKHGISKIKQGGTVTISAKLENQADKIHMVLTVADTGAKLDLINAATGVGLSNVRQRLKNYYGNTASFDIYADEKQTTAEIKIPFSVSTAREERADQKASDPDDNKLRITNYE